MNYLNTFQKLMEGKARALLHLRFFFVYIFDKRLWQYMVINLWWFSFQFRVSSVHRLTDKLIFFAAKKNRLLNHFAQSLLLASLFLLFSPPTTCIILVNLICPLALMNRNNQNWPHVRLCWEMTKRESHRKEFTFIHKLILKLQIQGVQYQNHAFKFIKYIMAW